MEILIFDPRGSKKFIAYYIAIILGILRWVKLLNILAKLNFTGEFSVHIG